MSKSQPTPGSESYWSDLSEQGERESEADAARFYGLRAEEYARERFGFILHETGHSDALVPYDNPTSEQRGERLPGDRRKVQIKGARLKIKDSNGSGGRSGRFKLWDTDHEKLVEDDALYLFLGYDPNDPEPVEMVRFVPARELDEVVGGITWYDTEHVTKDGRPTQISVRHVFPDL